MFSGLRKSDRHRQFRNHCYALKEYNDSHLLRMADDFFFSQSKARHAPCSKYRWGNGCEGNMLRLRFFVYNAQHVLKQWQIVCLFFSHWLRNSFIGISFCCLLTVFCCLNVYFFSNGGRSW